MLAAIAYQESHWDPQATSSGGAGPDDAGTQTPPMEIGDHRVDPLQSLRDGSRYLKLCQARQHRGQQPPGHSMLNSLSICGCTGAIPGRQTRSTLMLFCWDYSTMLILFLLNRDNRAAWTRI